MTYSTPELSQLQYWLSQVSNSHGDVSQKWLTSGLSLKQGAKAASRLAAEHQQQTYSAAHVKRLKACLKGEFSLLCALMGEDVFDVFAKACVMALPSQALTFHTLGKAFVRFLANSWPQGKFNASQSALFEVYVELARFERAKAEVLAAKGSEQMPPAEFALNEFELLGGGASLNIMVPDCVRLLVSEYDILPLLSQLENRQTKGAESPAMPARETRYIALTQQNGLLIAQPLTHWQADLLSHCNQATSFEQALAHSARRQGMEAAILRARLAMWLPAAVASGLLMVETAKRPTAAT
ncbi:putative DNA-binding domain-containing protein [Pseudoalteromonas rubra]|uniref:HvfC/BufC family peptide modification chaperone n=1 Tax=Pseudoalteromonas rubra TaxID=43658 RepID=UPI002DBB12BE|nr:putative DNA-binding domain-containing protein [Pseudoalteromonas rubra]MEC4091813.1 putative DNA-binding domain-containing protein [Pseudoalteromonas rubra]